jgi:ribosomal protein S18 acetylase RimI-like enzyme
VGRGGRFGKYGEHKRFERLRLSKKRGFISDRKPNSLASLSDPWRAPKKPTRVKLSFRKAYPRDLPFLAELSGHVFSAYGRYDEIIARWASFPHIITVVVEEEDQPRGFAMINPTIEAQNLPKGELMAIAVAPEHQGRTIGTRLLKYMEDLFRNLGIEEMIIHTASINRAAHRFFERNGFIQKGWIASYYPMGQRALEMSKMLTMNP